MISYIKSPYCVMDPLTTGSDDLSTISAEWSPELHNDATQAISAEDPVDTIAEALGIDASLIASLGNAHKRHRDAEAEVARLKRAYDEASHTLRVAFTELDAIRSRVKGSIA